LLCCPADPPDQGAAGGGVLGGGAGALGGLGVQSVGWPALHTCRHNRARTHP
jgi:hypothetical protein